MAVPTALAIAAAAIGTAKSAITACNEARKGITALAGRLRDKDAKADLLELANSVADIGFQLNELRDANAELKTALEKAQEQEDLSGVLKEKAGMLWLENKRGRFFAGYYCKPCFVQDKVCAVVEESNADFALISGRWKCSTCKATFRGGESDEDDDQDLLAPFLG